MTRIFITLAYLALILMSATLVLGLSVGDLHKQPTPDDLRWATIHRLSGVAAALAVVLVNSIVITYFIGTSRWCREVSDAYQLGPALTQRSNAIKRRAFPWAVTGMLAVVGVIALGGAADPSSGRPGTEDWVNAHLIGAMAGLVFIAWSFFIQWQHIRANHMVIGQVLTEVRRIRAERGLEV